ncbi:MAG: hypothetical protein EA401_13140 [Planctomycetota bacterium]|nr:MAG: hypothetical protein EA401_13140 [Planctomycetota bacterium]
MRGNYSSNNIIKNLVLVSLILFPAAAVAEDSWPMWMRDSQGGPIAGEPQLRDPQLTQQTRVWVSEADIPPGRVSDGRGAGGREDMQQPASGGFASPIAADGKVFHWNYRPSGNVYDIPRARALGLSQEELRAQASPLQGNLVTGHERWLVSATDVLTAIDAATGATLWQTELTNQGVNWGLFNKAGGGMTPVYHDGMVIAMSTSAQVFGVDAATGEVRWTHDLMPRHLQNMAYRQAAMQGDSMAPRFNRDFLVALVAADGIVVINDQRWHSVQNSDGTTYHYDTYNSYLGLDVHSGEQRWEAKEVGDTRGSPVLWEHNGTTYVLAINRFHLTLHDIATGREIWRHPQGHAAMFDLAVSDRFVVMNARQEGSRKTEITGYAIDLNGMQQLWTWGDQRFHSNILAVGDYGYMHFDNHLRCFDLATGETVKDLPIGRIPTDNGNPFIAYYGGWLVTMGGDAGSGYTFVHANPEHMEASKRFFPADVGRGYGCLVFPAFAGSTMFFRTQDSAKIEAYRLR